MSELDRGALPLADYDHLTIGSLQSRIHHLQPEEVDTLIAYEREHGGRVPVLAVLESRLEALRARARVAAGDGSTAPAPESARGARGGSKVDPSTAGPPVNPPSHADPTNPAQPRT
jgi:hypothetical protein